MEGLLRGSRGAPLNTLPLSSREGERGTREGERGEGERGGGWGVSAEVSKGVLGVTAGEPSYIPEDEGICKKRIEL